MTRDSQRSAVYRWEREVAKRFSLSERMSLDECKALIREVWDDYRPGDEIPYVKDGRGTRVARGGRWSINLPKWARTRIIVLHEIAHSLKYTEPWHGPEFAGLLLDLMERYAGVPRVEARRMGIHQKPRRVRFAVAARVQKRRSRKWKAWKKEYEETFAAWKKVRDSEPPKYV